MVQLTLGSNRGGLTAASFVLFCLLVSLLSMAPPAAATSSGVLFTVEEAPKRQPSRHMHRIRHNRRSRDTKPSPYKSAASTLVNPSTSHQYESFSLNCPHVTDASNENVRIEVTWTLNDTIWLKIEDGEQRIFNKLTTFNKRTMSGKTVLRVLLNNGRYFFDYDELTGDFAMEIRPVEVFEDSGVWQCHVTVHQRGNTHTLTSRSRVKIPHGHRHDDRVRSSSLASGPPQSHQRGIYESFPLFAHQQQQQEMGRGEQEHVRQAPVAKISSFSRNDQEVVHISRDDVKRRQTVVFDRQQPIASARHAQPAIDYEMSMDEEPFYSPRSRARSAFYENSLPSTSRPYLISLITVIIFSIYRLNY